ncbi:unnamed protein product [Closterium sp. NIES-65]|nr:unnamed protein product [Closterium sp. NIES-65]
MPWVHASEATHSLPSLLLPPLPPAGIVTDSTTPHGITSTAHLEPMSWGCAIIPFRSLSSCRIVTDGTTRHYFHRPSRAYAMGLRKRRKVFSDRPSPAAATLPHRHCGGGGCGWRTGGVRIGWKKILVLYETRAQRGKKRGRTSGAALQGAAGKDRKTNWIMHQYHVGEQGEEKEGEWVVSKVFYQIQQRQSSGESRTGRGHCPLV